MYNEVFERVRLLLNVGDQSLWMIRFYMDNIDLAVLSETMDQAIVLSWMLFFQSEFALRRVALGVTPSRIISSIRTNPGILPPIGWNELENMVRIA